MCAHENRRGRYANFYGFVKNFVKCDSISTIRRAAVIRLQRTNAPRRFVDAISIVSFPFILTQWLGSTIYEDKGA